MKATKLDATSPPPASSERESSRTTAQRPEWTRWFDSPLGPLGATADAEGLIRRLEFVDPADESAATKNSVEPSLSTAAGVALAEVGKQLDEYFALSRREFDLPLRPVGTAFQEQVWHALLAIPFGATESYGGLAHRIDNPKAVRAVGRANGANPIAIVIPCHRVIGNDGSLTGYGGGIERKRWLLQHEGVLLRF
ncbi:MAG: methylated-DNA--[protein]-cysteine S-methyltransferase [Thermoanaerobaculia bacterium]|nr:methylated-DNA--[protein]-cysteine S-methyltransferase [Thermoanaerobaculia bacterium]